MSKVQREQRYRSTAGFTLIEMLVVIVILGILAAVVVLATGGITDRGQQSACEIEERSIRTAVESYRSVNGATVLPADVGEMVPEFLSEDPKLYDYEDNSDGTFTLDPKTGSGCPT